MATRKVLVATGDIRIGIGRDKEKTRLSIPKNGEVPLDDERIDRNLLQELMESKSIEIREVDDDTQTLAASPEEKASSELDHFLKANAPKLVKGIDVPDTEAEKEKLVKEQKGAGFETADEANQQETERRTQEASTVAAPARKPDGSRAR